jgi:hypothetical protein
LNEETLAAIPAMNAASRPVTATPSTPRGRYWLYSAGMASLYVRPPAVPSPGISRIAAMPGMTVPSGMITFG